ncbi:hypothetical protein LPJ66_006634 [Kickxella alabastrina]|uniref:Uncharacterized protein n=1 Tax=Kickxella alabastrina TaxID=61397 RepID=A0ACC1IJG1_9FUNG|nr:hypothetical protein LPJ66_006634 [Kickxella alabastrina]
MALVDSVDLVRVSSVDTLFTQAECQSIYQQNPALLEIRDFVVKYAPNAHSSSKDQQQQPETRAAPQPQPSQELQPSIPITSLRDIITSLLEEKRHEDGVRFLTAVGSASLVQDARVVGNLLNIFKPTHILEKDLKQRSSFLLETLKRNAEDHSELWQISNKRLQAIIQSQQSVLTYLRSVKTQFLRPWFKDKCAMSPGKFWDLMDELTGLPQEGSDEEANLLELEMYQHRVMLACILLEQMRADMAANVGDIWESMFLKIVSEGFVSSGRISHPKKLLATLFARFKGISHDRCPHEESKIVALLLDMLAVASCCGAISRDSCVQAIAKDLVDLETNEYVGFIDLVDSDILAIEIISYTLVSWFRLEMVPAAAGESKSKRGRERALLLPAGVAKTAFFLEATRPRQKPELAAYWYDLICVLSRLVQRTVNAFERRLCFANSESTHSTSAHLLVLMVTAKHPEAFVVLTDAYSKLMDYLEAALPQPSAIDVDTFSPSSLDSDNDGNGCERDDDNDDEEAEMLVSVYEELDILGKYLRDE